MDIHRPASVLFTRLLLTLLVMPSSIFAENTDTAEKKCLYVSSYHEGYEWSDDIEASIRASLIGHCELRKLDMDTKRNKSAESIFNATNRAIKTIEEWQPDVVITSDDGAAKYLIAPHYKDDPIPFVFCGVNWTVEEYGFPYSNVTGIVEVAPVRTMLEEAFKLSSDKRSGMGRKAAFIGANTLSEKKNFSRIEAVAQDLNIEIEAIYASNFLQWTKALQRSSEYDFTVMGSNAGIEDWNEEEATTSALEYATKVSVTTDKWMMPFATFGFTKLAKEQGDWSASVAIKILQGTNPADIPLASNKKWDLWVNESILSKLNLQLSRRLLRKAKRLKIASSEE